MSKELIEAVAAEMNRLGYGYHESHAESIVLAMAKAAPVAEREAFEAHVRIGGYSNPDKHPDGSYVSSVMELWWQGWKARAAYQRAQQPQSAGRTCMGCVEQASRIRELEHKMDYYTTPQPSAGVVMPDADGSATQKSFWAGFESASLRLFGTDIRKAWNSYKASDEFARLNGKEVGRE